MFPASYQPGPLHWLLRPTSDDWKAISRWGFCKKILPWVVRRQGEPPLADPRDPLLGERARLVLQVLLKDNAFNSDHRMVTADISLKAAGKEADPNQYKEVVANLRGVGYVDTKEGRGGGCWLTALGRERADKL